MRIKNKLILTLYNQAKYYLSISILAIVYILLI
jgi:hypothetical protein